MRSLSETRRTGAQSLGGGQPQVPETGLPPLVPSFLGGHIAQGPCGHRRHMRHPTVVPASKTHL